MPDDREIHDEAGSANVGAANAEPTDDSGALLSRLRVIEDQPLDQRASAYVQIHDGLQSTLEGRDSPGQHG